MTTIAAHAPARLPLTVNYHFIKNCNFACQYCFATFDDQKGALRLPDQPLMDLTRLLSRRYTKVTFAGGEPTLYPRLHRMIAAAKQEGALTNLVTNGSRIDTEWIVANAGNLDLLTLSADSISPGSQRAIGRADRAGRTTPAQHHIDLADAARTHGVRVKLNTVVTTINQTEDLAEFVCAMQPERWKILQAAPVDGQNDGRIESLIPERANFDAYVARHGAALRGTSIRIVPEPIDVIRGSYIMVDPQGRFFDSTTGRHRYSAPILDVGHDAAFAEVSFDHGKFTTRGGAHDYGASDTPAPAMARKFARVASPTRAGETADTPSRRTTH